MGTYTKFTSNIGSLVPTRRSMEETSYQERLGLRAHPKVEDNKTCFTLLVCIPCKGLISWSICFDCVTKEACVGRSKIPQMECPMACNALHNLYLIVACLQVPSISHFKWIVFWSLSSNPTILTLGLHTIWKLCIKFFKPFPIARAINFWEPPSILRKKLIRLNGRIDGRVVGYESLPSKVQLLGNGTPSIQSIRLWGPTFQPFWGGSCLCII